MLIRIITALVLAPLALAGIYLLELLGFALVVAAITALASYEWAGLVFVSARDSARGAGAQSTVTQLLAAVVFVVTTLAICGWLWVRPELQSQWLIVACVCWAWAIVEVLIFPKQIPVAESAANGQAAPRGNLRWIVFGLVVLPGAWIAMLLLKERDPHLMVLVCFLVWGADAGAYFVGKALGRRKLAPKVSPGKTWEGALGGSVVGVFAATCFGYFLLAPVREELLLWVLAFMALTAISVFGDLFESILKRTAGAKDSGRLLPGHGGVLDRIDALIAVLPAMALLVLMGPSGGFSV